MTFHKSFIVHFRIGGIVDTHVGLQVREDTPVENNLAELDKTISPIVDFQER